MLGHTIRKARAAHHRTYHNYHSSSILMMSLKYCIVPLFDFLGRKIWSVKFEGTQHESLTCIQLITLFEGFTKLMHSHIQDDRCQNFTLSDWWSPWQLIYCYPNQLSYSKVNLHGRPSCMRHSSHLTDDNLKYFLES